MSTFADSFIVVHVPDEYDAVFSCDYNTEFAARVRQVCNASISFTDKYNISIYSFTFFRIEYKRAKGSKATLVFERRDGHGDQLVTFKKGVVSVPQGLPVNSG